jgi:hypothetical protein
MNRIRHSATVASLPCWQRVALVAALCIVAALTPVARAQEPARANAWQFQLTPYGWFAGLIAPALIDSTVHHRAWAHST